MAVKSNHAIAIMTVSDWLKNVVPGIQAMRSKTNCTLYAQFFPHFEQAQGNNCKEF